jgi:hypothetical protein
MKKITRRFLLLVLVVTVSITTPYCQNIKQKKQDLYAIRFIESFPANIYMEDGQSKVYCFQDTIITFYYQNFKVYRLSETRQWETDEIIPGTERYFFYEKGTKFVYQFNSFKDTIAKRDELVDSFIWKNRLIDEKFVKLDTPFWKFLKSDTIDQGQTFIEKYIPSAKPDETCFDSIYYYFANIYDDVDFTMSTSLDSSHGMKLYKARLMFNAYYSQTQKREIPKREFLFKIDIADIKNHKEVVDFFERIKKGEIHFIE